MFSVNWYRKPSSKNILIHATSAHPTSIKRSVVRNMFHTASQVCTGEEERQESLRMASNIAMENGYVSPRYRRRVPASRRQNGPRDNRIPLCIPFISDKVTATIQKSIVRAQLQNDVVLVNIPNDTIKRQLVRNRLYENQCLSDSCVICPYGKIGDCSREGAVYQIECQTCNCTYIGETGKKLAI